MFWNEITHNLGLNSSGLNYSSSFLGWGSVGIEDVLAPTLAVGRRWDAIVKQLTEEWQFG